MKHLEIYNFGPIKEAVVDFGRVNVFIGGQGAGKSCLLKIACNCAWVEKRLMLTRNVEYFASDNMFMKQLLEFHKLEGYDTNKDMRILYRSSFLEMEYVHKTETFTCKFFSNTRYYRRAKLSYIPAERNLIATIPNLMELSFENDNTQSFLVDWDNARRYFSTTQLDILSTGAKYYFDEATWTDMVQFREMKKPLPMARISSGMQSLIPMLLYVNYLTSEALHEDNETVTRRKENKLLAHRMYATRLKSLRRKDFTSKAQRYDLRIDNEFYTFPSEKDLISFAKQYVNYTSYQYSEIYLEEPEENLFPTTQVQLLQNLLQLIFAPDAGHSLFLATHSPYLLYGLNNAILANIVRRNIPASILNEMQCSHAIFKPHDIKVWQLEDGHIKQMEGGTDNTIQDGSGLIRANFFDGVMKHIMNEFNNMLSFRDNG